ncbi:MULTISPECIES: Maf family protein [Acidaminococcus]|uniref:Maf family protein n=1 Tax=Acidaminococcus TaxID=904 RepID=UPI0025987D13|nr:Maf family protein [Acidaminococcus sp.]MDO5597594.1 Maf family protein [Acidaminococcus sp.]
MELILASGSPRRLELLRQIGVEPKVVVSHSNEEKTAASPAVLVQDNALAKGRDVVQKVGDAVPVLAADTVVALEGHILGKPGTPEKARAMLHQLSGRTHQVLTGLALFYRGKVWQHVEVTEVTFARLTDREIQQYTATGEPLDKAGAYGIQGRAALFIPSIRGSYSNVVGLPLAPLRTIFAELDVTPNDTLPDTRNDTGGTAS